MSFVSDKLYNGYVRRNMATIVSRVKAGEIMVHLPCLTSHDRETIEARGQMCSNRDAMSLLLDCLKRRENWPEQFIQALEACEHHNLAAEFRKEYNAVMGIRDPVPGSPSQSVVTAHAHLAPSTAHTAQTRQVAAGLPEPTGENLPGAPQSPAVAPPQATPPPPPAEAAAQPPAPRTPSPSPPPQASMSPPPQINSDAHQQPEENSELEIQEGRGDEDRRDTDTPPPPPQSISLTNSDVTDGSYLTLTPEKLPVQDSNPPDAKVAPSSPQMEATSAAHAVDAVDGGLSLSDDASVCLSKPSQLLSMQPQNHAGSAAQRLGGLGIGDTLHVPDLPGSAYSGDSGRLQMSVSVADAPSARLPCQESSDALSYNEPEENYYESPCESIAEDEGHVAEEPSVQNLDGRSLLRPAPNANGDAGKEVETVPLASAAATTPKQDPKLNRSLSTKAAYISVAVGVATCAVLVGWRFMK